MSHINGGNGPRKGPTIERLRKLCGMLGSEYAGERAAAGAMADKLLRESNMTWADVLGPRHDEAPKPRTPITEAEQIDFVAQHASVLNDWEREFLKNISGRSYLTSKQRDKLGDLVAKVRTWETCAKARQ